MKPDYRLISLICLVCSSFSVKAQEKQESIFDVSGYLMLDYDSFDSLFLEDSSDSGDEFELRRARLSLKSKLNNDWRTKLQLSYDDEELEIKDAYFEYQGLDWFSVTIGKHKEPFGLEKLTGSRNLLMIERSMVSEAFAPGRNPGIGFSGEQKTWTWDLGYFESDDDETAITGRVTWLPWRKKNDFLHLGVAFSERDLDQQEFRINETLEVHSADSMFEGINLNADKQSLFGVEVLWQEDSFTLMSEWQQLSVLEQDGQEYDYEGGYLQLSYRFGGATRKYKNGILKGLKGKSDAGDWEITLRASELRLLEENKSAETLSLGLNYYWNKNIKLMANYTDGKIFENDSLLESGDAISLRAQYSF